jgi:hypothetical protein
MVDALIIASTLVHIQPRVIALAHGSNCGLILRRKREARPLEERPGTSPRRPPNHGTTAERSRQPRNAGLASQRSVCQVTIFSLVERYGHDTPVGLAAVRLSRSYSEKILVACPSHSLGRRYRRSAGDARGSVSKTARLPNRPRHRCIAPVSHSSLCRSAQAPQRSRPCALGYAALVGFLRLQSDSRVLQSLQS